MKKKITTLFLLALGATTYAQVVPGVGIGTPLPAQSAMLEIDSADKGVLIPRVTISDLKAYGLAGGVAVEGMLVFNNTAKVDPADAKKNLISVGFHYWSAATAQWELITSQSQLNTVVKEIKEDVKTEIEKITNITGGTEGDNSYLVSFKPDSDGKDGTTGVLSYLYPKKDTAGKITGYEKKTISFADLVKGEETNTFIREIKELVKFTDNNVEKEELRVVAYVYFSEAAIRKFKADKPDEAIDKITDDYGTKLDISAVVTNNTKNIFNDKETIKEVTKILESAKDVVRAVPDGKGGDGVKLVYKAVENGPDIDFPINLLETKTKFGRLASDKDLDAIADTDYKPVVDAPQKAKAGEVIYQYYGEDKTAPNFINITADVIKTINENTDVKNTFNNTVNKFLSQGGNVYYGKINGGTDNVLFEKIEKTENGVTTYVDTPIDISKDILKVIEKDNKLIEKIKELGTIVVDGGGSKTGEVIDGFHVYKAMLPGTVEEKSVGLGYNSNFKENLKPNNFKRLKSIQILTKDGQLVLNNVTDVTYVNATTGLAFNFGAGKMYTPLKAGAYDVVLEYISTEAYVAPTPQP
ncbi:hypothetical protein [Myroides marinus]|uniref:Uncharacterized protein n=1 Tax=Myroides marinus TaxID=703342 RepID=A0A1H6WZZ2_9FLAO|nr:hypothetical protein [Myroides marinus]MDM1378019.1 hypothetical protein [Myroides marinus]MDM1385290.1 hypothetical protein [Myroides marinus]MDM1392503.1 hypothetical protein [Myroides marinus]MDM1503754.1 hypothetical protein [Myroides marinus]SEJ22461.1 hypothetical protein SAMN04488018_11763 [Myroides marinus]